jgi:hypothetical protein
MSEEPSLRQQIESLREFQSNTDSPVIAGRMDDPEPPAPAVDGPKIPTDLIKALGMVECGLADTQFSELANAARLAAAYIVSADSWIAAQTAEVERLTEEHRFAQDECGRLQMVEDELKATLADLAAARGALEALGWRALESAPKDGTIIDGLYQEGPCLIRWAETRRCMLAGVGGGNGYFGAGWEDDENHLIMDPPIMWRLEQALTPAPERDGREGA